MLVDEKDGDIFPFGELLESRFDDAGLRLCCIVSSPFFVLELSRLHGRHVPLVSQRGPCQPDCMIFPCPLRLFPYTLRREHASRLPSLGPFVSKTDLLESTIRKFFFWCWSTCPIPARSRPVMESYRVSIHSV
jgi:hypothetical protein